MKKALATALSILLGAALFFVPISVMLYAALEMEKLRETWLRGPAIVLALVAGVLLFVATTFVSTHLVVRLFRQPNGQQNQQVK
jgi:putative effector of murein hydrolase LrgA (UPF0299 family)